MSKISTAKMYVRRTSKLPSPTDLYDPSRHPPRWRRVGPDELRGQPTLSSTPPASAASPRSTRACRSSTSATATAGCSCSAPVGDFADQEFDAGERDRRLLPEELRRRFPLTERTSVRADLPRCGATWPASPTLGRRCGTSPSTWWVPTAAIARWPTKVKPEDPQIVAAIEAALPNPPRP